MSRPHVSLPYFAGFIALFLLFSNAHAVESQFASEELKLLGAEQSAIFTQQVLLVGHSKIIKASRAKPELQQLKKYLNTGLFLTNFAMSQVLQAEYTAAVDAAMLRNPKITYVTKLAQQPQGAILTALSAVDVDDEQSIVEVVIAAFDWEQATTRQEGMAGIVQSVVWYAVGRTAIPISTATLQDVGAEPLVQQAYKALLSSAFEAFLLAY